MSSEPLDENVTARICRHMNADHMNAVMKYASYYGGIKHFKEARMKKLNSKFFELEVDKEIIRIPFDHTLQNRDDAHKTLVKMIKSITE